MYLPELILLIYFSYVSLYAFTLSVAGMFYKSNKPPASTVKRKIAVLIPAYREDQVIESVAVQALQQDYPPDHFDVIVISDSLKPSTLERLRMLPLVLIEVTFDKSTKVKALNSAMAIIGDRYDCALVLDADNVMEENFISRMNDLYEAGYRAIQGRRAPKNENTPMALLDGLSETINNFICRQGTVAIGMSASLNGSGMLFDYSVYKRIMAGMDSIGGFDRELEIKLLEEGIKVQYAKDIVVYDEKVLNTEVFEKQRKRWISSQFFYLRKYFVRGCLGLFKGNFTFFNSTVMRNIQLPRLVNLGLLAGIAVVSIVLHRYAAFPPWVWIGLLTLNLLAMIFAIPSRFYSVRLLKSVLLVPSIFFRMFLLLFRLRGANKTFIHTPHGHVETQPTNAEKL